MEICRDGSRCPLCSSEDIEHITDMAVPSKALEGSVVGRVVRGNRYTYLHCRGCSLYFTRDPVSRLELEEARPLIGAGEQEALTLEGVRSFYRYRALGSMCRRLGRIVDYSRTESMLEVGPFNGGFIDHLLRRQDGIEVYVKEPTSWVHALARMYGAKPVDAFYLDEWKGYENVHFDLIVSFETLEHLPDPLKELQALRRSLTKGGRLFFSVPNGDYFRLKVRLTGRGIPTSHFYHFTPASIKELCRRAGLTVQRQWILRRQFHPPRPLRQLVADVSHLAAHMEWGLLRKTQLASSYLTECAAV